MDDENFLADRFEADRGHLRAVAYRMLGSLAEAEDAVQEAWLRLSRSDTSAVENLSGWLTTVVGRVCLDMLRSRKSRDSLESAVPEPIVAGPEEQAALADSVGLALLVVLQALTPAERLAFVLHDMFGVSFDEIAPIVDRTPAATRQLASRARRRVQGTPTPETDLSRQRRVVEAFMAASRGGSFDALVAVLAPDVVLRVDGGLLAPSKVVTGAANVANNALMFTRFAPYARLALVNGGFGTVTVVDGEPISVMGFTVAGGQVVEIDILSDPDRLKAIDLSAFGG
ncbi:sigma-70 family RNA polymerase sigma factor [Actinokineospora sp. HUAS TT18]|uniref:sigma-70 family RNA polymerase sigma factor n=1 Tax=Actinokineospora sp. HUAS TT18 TaxID=3447451 RepID=UPI003F528844